MLWRGKSARQGGFWYQLKSQKSRLGESITDGAYAAMMNAIRHDELPSFYFMQYDLMTWSVRNLLLVPHFAFPPSAIIKRKPLLPTARRAGWVGCNFALNRIPIEARIAIVITRSSGRESAPISSGESQESQSRLSSAATVIVTPEEVREKFKRIKPLKEISVTQRGWTLDVLNAIRRLGKTDFTTADAYAFTRELEKLHPATPIVIASRPSRPRHLSRLGNGERNSTEGEGPRGPSERARASPNPPATSSAARCRAVIAHRARSLASAVTLNIQLLTLNHFGVWHLP
jgi:hypothetical protein